MVNTTENTWAQDKTLVPTIEVLPELLLAQLTTVVFTGIAGDAEYVRLPLLGRAQAEVVDEGAPLTPQDINIDETTVLTRTIGNLVMLSDEMAQNLDGNLMVANMSAALVRRSNDELLNGTNGLVSQARAAGAVTTDLDAVSDAVYDTGADFMLVSVGAAKALARLKDQEASNRQLVANLNDLFGLDVIVSHDLPGNNVLVGSRGAVVSAVSGIEVAKSKDWAFDRRAVAYRASFRQGFAVANADGLALLTAE